MNSNNELPAWMEMTKGGKRTSAYSAPAAKKKVKKKTRPRKEQIERQTQGKPGN